MTAVGMDGEKAGHAWHAPGQFVRIRLGPAGDRAAPFQASRGPRGPKAPAAEAAPGQLGHEIADGHLGTLAGGLKVPGIGTFSQSCALSFRAAGFNGGGSHGEPKPLESHGCTDCRCCDTDICGRRASRPGAADINATEHPALTCRGCGTGPGFAGRDRSPQASRGTLGSSRARASLGLAPPALGVTLVRRKAV